MTGCESRYENFEQMLNQTGEYVTQVRGVSMYPMLRYRKDPVLIHPVREELKPYDVAVYAKSDRYVVHRVLEVRDNIYVIRGDNCIGKEYVPKSDVRGVVVGFWRFGRYIPCDDRLYNAYARLWVTINPLVRMTHWCKGMCRSAISKIWRFLSRT
ncbi:MAG: S24/S26 family peptidase [Paludibacteraceae bacterium]|nr:S24/S26 family peptidase [Paludibacteraceae bacterium]